MEKKMKSLNDVLMQLTRIQGTYHSGRRVKAAYAIAQHYISQIEETQKVWGETPNEYRKYSHAVRSYMPDTPREQIKALKPWKKEGLYALDNNGNKITPTRLYFGVDTRLFRPDGGPCGRCYYFYGYGLCPVYLPDGTRYREPTLSNVCCRYKDGVLSDFYRE